LCDFLVNKSCETYLGPTPPPFGRKWQVINPYPHLADDQLEVLDVLCEFLDLHLGLLLGLLDGRPRLLLLGQALLGFLEICKTQHQGLIHDTLLSWGLYYKTFYGRNLRIFEII
jgi:hypothetical protein